LFRSFGPWPQSAAASSAAVTNPSMEGHSRVSRDNVWHMDARICKQEEG
jgi:hypothetical protein